VCALVTLLIIIYVSIGQCHNPEFQLCEHWSHSPISAVCALVTPGISAVCALVTPGISAVCALVTLSNLRSETIGYTPDYQLCEHWSHSRISAVCVLVTLPNLNYLYAHWSHSPISVMCAHWSHSRIAAEGLIGVHSVFCAVAGQDVGGPASAGVVQRGPASAGVVQRGPASAGVVQRCTASAGVVQRCAASRIICCCPVLKLSGVLASVGPYRMYLQQLPSFSISL